VFVLTHEPPGPPDPAVAFLTGDIMEAAATALDAAGGRNLEILGADVAGQCLQRGPVDEILVSVLPVVHDLRPFASCSNRWSAAYTRSIRTIAESIRWHIVQPRAAGAGDHNPDPCPGVVVSGSRRGKHLRRSPG